MTLISFQHSIKYIYLQLVPYLALTIATGYMASGVNILWIMVYLVVSGLFICRLITLTSTQYLFTHDMLIISNGVIFKKVDCRSLWQLKGMEIRYNRFLALINISHIQCGLEGPPADRIRIVGVDNRMMAKIFEQLNEAIEINIQVWRSHFEATNS